MSKTFKPDMVLNGTWGKVWLDSDYMAQATALQAKFKLTKTDVTQTGTLAKGQKITGVTFDELTLADWEAGKLGEESYAFTFEDAELIDAIPD